MLDNFPTYFMQCSFCFVARCRVLICASYNTQIDCEIIMWGGAKNECNKWNWAERCMLMYINTFKLGAYISTPNVFKYTLMDYSRFPTGKHHTLKYRRIHHHTAHNTRRRCACEIRDCIWIMYRPDHFNRRQHKPTLPNLLSLSCIITNRQYLPSAI